jgi:hypothetical protein
VSTDKTGADGTSPKLDEMVGGFGGLSFGHTITPNTDWRVGLAYSQFSDHATTDPTAGDTVTLASTLRFATADFDVGFSPWSGEKNFRLFGGLRVLDAQASADKVGGAFDTHDTSDLLGAGPRLGAEFEDRFGAGPWGLSGSIAGAAIFGDRKTADSAADTSRHSTVATYNLEGDIGLDYHASRSSTWTVGVRAQQWWNLRIGSDDPHLAVDPDVLDWGPFVKFVKRM